MGRKNRKSLFLEKIYDARKALTIFILDALQAGRNPPRNPITVAKIKQFTTIEGLRANPKEISENDVKFIVEIEKNCNVEARTKPIPAPINAINIASMRNAERTFLLRKPRARNVPTSIVRFATAEYIVIIAPIIAPMLKINVIVFPKIVMNIAIASDCSR